VEEYRAYLSKRQDECLKAESVMAWVRGDVAEIVFWGERRARIAA
jgi:hypothetical protein